MSDTPRTDALVVYDLQSDDNYFGAIEFARQLERDLAAANAENAVLRDAINDALPYSAQAMQIDELKRDLAAALQRAEADAALWKRYAEIYYGALTYPGKEHLAEGALDALFRKERAAIDAAMKDPK